MLLYFLLSSLCPTEKKLMLINIFFQNDSHKLTVKVGESSRYFEK